MHVFLSEFITFRAGVILQEPYFNFAQYRCSDMTVPYRLWLMNDRHCGDRLDIEGLLSDSGLTVAVK
jgi:hypothetical protein